MLSRLEHALQTWTHYNRMTSKSSLTDDDNEEIQRHDRSSPVEHDAEAVLEFVETADVVGGTVEWIHADKAISQATSVREGILYSNGKNFILLWINRRSQIFFTWQAWALKLWMNCCKS